MKKKVLHMQISAEDHKRLFEKHNKQIESGEIPISTSVSWRVRDLIKKWINE
jgi:hypothetical protein